MKKNVLKPLFIGLMSFLTFFTGCNKKSIKIAFCNVSEQVQSSIEETLTQNFPEKFSFQKINGVTVENSKKIAKKYDLVFAENGQTVDNLLSYANDFPSELVSSFPDSIIQNETKALPVVLNHYGMAYSTVVKSKAKIRYPGNFNQFEQYLARISIETDFPLFVAAEDDYTLLTFLSCLFEGYTGTDGYLDFVKALKNYRNKKDFLDTVVADSITIEEVLSILKDYQDMGYLTKGWANAKFSDLKVLSQEDKIGVAFLSLEQFHSMKNEIASKFVCDRFPVKQPRIPHSLICPSVVCLNLSSKPVANQIQSYLIEEPVQKQLSKTTTLAPAHVSAQAYDKQSDDVRFLATACKNGPIAPASALVLESDPAKLHKICQDLRAFFR